MGGRPLIGTLGGGWSIGSGVAARRQKEVRMAPVRVGLAGMPMCRPSALVEIGVHWM